MLRFIMKMAVVLGWVVAASSALAQDAKRDPEGVAFFERKIRPVLVEHCCRCHSAEAKTNKKLKGGLLLDSREGIRKGGVSGPAIDLNKASDSLLIKALRHEDDLRMPPNKKLPDQVIADFVLWVTRGAPDPRGQPASAAVSPRDHWAFQPLRTTAPPPSTDPWAKNPIDRFVLRDLQAKGLTPGRQAEMRVLVRRLSFDLVGLPPTANDFDEVRAAPAGNGIDALIEKLLQSPQHGERWAQHWLDVARYADSAGYSVDTARPTMHRYRDFVIQSINDDLPFDQFVRWQLAGDLASNKAAHVATGFCTCGPFNTNSPKEIDRYDELDDILTTTGQAFLGLNLGCARCHNHKYDPISQVEYYRLLAVFNSSQRTERPAWSKAEFAKVEADRLLKIESLKLPAEDRELLKRPLDRKNARQLALHGKYPSLAGSPRNQTEHVLAEKGGPVGKSFLLERGNIERPGQPLTAGFLTALMRGNGTEAYWLDKGRVHPRAALAEWLVDVERGAGALTARVIVNRLWQHHFGVGLVRTPSDFGVQGESPTHPELLDWLASELIRNDWRLRPIHRLLVRSATYQQASTFDPAKAAVDPDHRLWWRVSPRRLDAEAIRDAILSVSGGLDRAMYGPAVYPLIPPEAMLPAAYTAWENSTKDDPKTWRRSIYVFVKRSTPVPLFQAFDRPDRTISTGKRHRTTIVPQALHLVNDPMIRTQSVLFAERVAKEAGSEPSARIRHACLLALGREPDSSEARQMLAFLTDAQRPAQPKAAAPSSDMTALADLCQGIVMLNEFMYID